MDTFADNFVKSAMVPQFLRTAMQFAKRAPGRVAGAFKRPPVTPLPAAAPPPMFTGSRVRGTYTAPNSAFRRNFTGNTPGPRAAIPQPSPAAAPAAGPTAPTTPSRWSKYRPGLTTMLFAPAVGGGLIQAGQGAFGLYDGFQGYAKGMEDGIAKTTVGMAQAPFLEKLMMLLFPETTLKSDAFRNRVVAAGGKANSWFGPSVANSAVDKIHAMLGGKNPTPGWQAYQVEMDKYQRMLAAVNDPEQWKKQNQVAPL